jgi:class 3 adenylate cyclase
LAEWVPNITHSERQELEAESALYYANDTTIDYRGLLGLSPNPYNSTEEMGLFPRTKQPFYFPIQYLEPYENIGDAVHLDLYSLPYEQEAIDLAIETYKPALTKRFEIESQDTDGYSVSLIHPGVKLPLPNEGSTTAKPQDVALLLIHIRSLLERAAKTAIFNKAVYLYDNIKPGHTEYLGGINMMMTDDGEDSYPQLTFYDQEVVLEDVLGETDRMHHVSSLTAGQRNWRIVCVSVDDTYRPNNFSANIGGAMIFLASLMMAWIWIIHNKNRSKHVVKIVKKAAAEHSIVKDLYPKNVRDRLIQQNTNKTAATMEDHNTILNFHWPMPQKTDGIEDDDVPIADEYPNTTIMFADMAGFTSWSSNREPKTVFKLLETLYGAFDAIAKQRSVFKVETIGDCYLAAAGIPYAQPKHAVIMTNFARQCMLRMREIVHELADELGEDTLNLQLRIGLHSGPVTAGVLRGQKARFQLFGDTVNTASRMESNGIKGRVHCSQETADALILEGKGYWLTPREEKIVAKGKGELQTYWILETDTKYSTSSTKYSTSSISEGASSSSSDDVQGIMNAIIEARLPMRDLEGVI